MQYLIIRISDNAVVDGASSEEAAKRMLAMYDSPEEPHKIRKEF